MFEQIKRNFKAYFRNKGSFYGSLVSMFVLLVLYALFLTDVLTDAVEAIFPADNAKAVVFGWLVCAMLTVNAINSTMAAVNVMVEDEERRKIKDFTISPFPAWKLTLSYIIAAVFAGLIVTLATLLLGFFLVLIFGKTTVGFLSLLETLPCIIVTVLAVAAITVFAYSYDSGRYDRLFDRRVYADRANGKGYTGYNKMRAVYLCGYVFPRGASERRFGGIFRRRSRGS